MKTLILKVLGMYREPDADKKLQAKIKPVTTSIVPRYYLLKFPDNDLKKINRNYTII